MDSGFFTSGIRLWQIQGRATFFYPFVEFVAACIAINAVVVFFLRRVNWERFIAIGGPARMEIYHSRRAEMTHWEETIFLGYAPLYFVSFLITSGLLLVPNLNVSSYFVPITQIVFQGNGVTMIGPLALNVDFLALGLVNTVVSVSSIDFRILH